MPLMNGISASEELREAFPENTVLTAVVYVDARKIGNELFCGETFLIQIGDAEEAVLESIKEALLSWGISCQICADITRRQWRKWMMNVGTNQVSAILGANYGQFQQKEAVRNMALAAMAEVVAVAEAAGVDLHAADVAAAGDSVNKWSAEGKCSMLQDVEAHRLTEVESFSGKLVELGKKYGVPTPINETLYALIRAKKVFLHFWRKTFLFLFFFSLCGWCCIIGRRTGGTKMDLRERLRTYGAGNAYPFHMPGHKRQKQQGSLFPYDLDITEIDGFDNLHHAEGILEEAMERAAKLWGSRKSFFLVNGSSSGLLAGIRAVTKRGDKVLMARGCHRAVYHAVELCGLHPVYMQAEWVEEMQISGSIQPETVEKHLQEHPDCKLVILTSPTYEGVVSDITEIAKVAHRYGAYLLVDEAHGAHLGFSKGFPDTSVHLGADVVVQSLHKTLPCPTQTAILHVCTEQVDVTEVGRQLSVFQTSSPSYVFMAEIDGCVSLLEQKRDSLFAAYE